MSEQLMAEVDRQQLAAEAAAMQARPSPLASVYSIYRETHHQVRCCPLRPSK